MKKKVFNFAKSSLGKLIVGIVFEKASKLLPIDRIFENDYLVAFWHPKPSYEKHILIVPKKAIENIFEINDQNNKYLLELFSVIKKIVKDLKLSDSDYSVITNGGTRQEIKQLHFHLISGKKL